MSGWINSKYRDPGYLRKQRKPKAKRKMTQTDYITLMAIEYMADVPWIAELTPEEKIALLDALTAKLKSAATEFLAEAKNGQL